MYTVLFFFKVQVFYSFFVRVVQKFFLECFMGFPYNCIAEKTAVFWKKNKKNNTWRMNYVCTVATGAWMPCTKVLKDFHSYNHIWAADCIMQQLLLVVSLKMSEGEITAGLFSLLMSDFTITMKNCMVALIVQLNLKLYVFDTDSLMK